MNLQTIAEHTVAMDLLPSYAMILDLGCRGFEFTNHFRLLGHDVYTVDADELNEGIYFRMAVTNFDGYATVIKSNDPQATRIIPKRKLAVMDSDVPCMTLKSMIERFGCLFDLIKMDIEGSEYETIMSMEKDFDYAPQISVEFHMHCGQTEEQVTEMVNKLHSLGYKTIQHEKTSRHGLQPNYWDSLFVL